MDMNALLYGPLGEEITDDILRKMLATLESMRDFRVLGDARRKMFGVTSVNDEEGLPVYTPVMVADNWRENYVADADPYLKKNYPEFAKGATDMLSLEDWSRKLAETLRRDGLMIVERWGVQRIERIPVRGDTGYVENLVCYYNAGQRYEIGESLVDGKIEAILRGKRKAVADRITEIIELTTRRRLQKEYGIGPTETAPVKKEQLARIVWAPGKQNQMIAWAKKLHELGLVRQEPDVILRHCICGKKVYNMAGQVVEETWDKSPFLAERLVWTAAVGRVLVMVSFLVEPKMKTKGDPTQNIVSLQKGEFYSHFHVDHGRMKRDLKKNEATLLIANQETAEIVDGPQKGQIYLYWRHKDQLFDFLRDEICANASQVTKTDDEEDTDKLKVKLR